MNTILKFSEYGCQQERSILVGQEINSLTHLQLMKNTYDNCSVILKEFLASIKHLSFQNGLFPKSHSLECMSRDLFMKHYDSSLLSQPKRSYLMAATLKFLKRKKEKKRIIGY
jgi:hypothetical protein